MPPADPAAVVPDDEAVIDCLKGQEWSLPTEEHARVSDPARERWRALVAERLSEWLSG